ncbi:MAG: phosphoglycerate dehydrogenase [Zetaproteobacteria bacterium]|nr:MAG: phosphoglycerate dehydrogenase [Zetaproteobacteria bacterium]
MAKVWIADKMSPQAVEIFRRRGIEVDYKPGLSEEEKLAIAGDYDGIAVRSATRLEGALLDAARRVKVIGRAGIGVDNIDVDACSRRGIVVMNTPFGNTVTTAELAVAHLAAAARMIPQADASTRAGKWEKSRFMGVELTGKKAGVVGAGNIGAIVCDRLRGLRMEVFVYDPFISRERAEAMGVTKVETLEALAEMVDVLTIHVPLVEATRNLIDAKILGRMKRGAILVNCARGGIVDEDALFDACKSGHLRAAALDVYAEEPARENRLFSLENVTFTPHIGASTDEAQQNVAVQIAEQMSDYLLEGRVKNGINVPSVGEEESRELGPFVTLCRRMGEFVGQMMRPGYSRVTLHFEGAVSSMNRKPLVNALLQGLLTHSFDEVNAVNAGVIARDRGIEVAEAARARSDHFSSLIRVEVEGDDGRRSVEGVLFDGTRPRLVTIDGCELEMDPRGTMIFLENHDRPGVIAGVGAVLARAGINIGDFRLGRRGTSGKAVALVSVDSTPDDAVLDELAALDAIEMARLIRLEG